jgi:nicotinamide mononucleotide (NMN) deamidase PncC
VYVGVAGPARTEAVRLHLEGDRRAVRDQTCRAALAAVLDAVTRG